MLTLRVKDGKPGKECDLKNTEPSAKHPFAESEVARTSPVLPGSLRVSALIERLILAHYVNPHEDFVLVLIATVSALCWPWAFRRELPTTTAKGTAVPAR